jgi:hypothetical protein
MTSQQIIQRCTLKLKMSTADAQWVADHLYDYCVPDFSEWGWAQIDQAFTDTLWFKGKSNAEIMEALA